MPTEIIVSVISFFGTLLGTVAGIVASGRLTAYRLAELEKKVEKHNNLVERMFTVEASVKSAHKRIDELHQK